MTEERVSDDLREAWEERSAIIAESMQLSRADAEAQAAMQMGLADDEIEFLQGTERR